MMARRRDNRLSRIWPVVALIAACGCATPVLSQTPDGHHNQPSNPIDAIGKGLKLRADPVDPVDFVKASRKPDADLQYVPLGGPRAEPPGRIMTPDEIKAKEADLDTTRSRQDKIARRAPLKGPFRSVAPDPIKPKVAQKPNCLITCTISDTVPNAVTTAVTPQPAASR